MRGDDGARPPERRAHPPPAVSQTPRADAAGATAAADCRPCPRGTYGDREGLAARECAGRCSDLDGAGTRFYGAGAGLTSRSDCRACPPGYLDAHGQCEGTQAFLERYLG